MSRIDKDIPIPPKRHGARARPEYATLIDQMEPGDSVLLPPRFQHDDPTLLRKVAESYVSRHTPYKPVTRKTPDGIRLWVINDE